MIIDPKTEVEKNAFNSLFNESCIPPIDTDEYEKVLVGGGERIEKMWEKELEFQKKYNSF